MSYKTSLIKLVINNTPTKVVLWAVNRKLKGIGELTDFSFNTNDRKLVVQVMLEGEVGPIELLLEKFIVVSNGESGHLVIQHVKSNRPWIDTILNEHLVDREWRIPDSKVAFVQELFESKK